MKVVVSGKVEDQAKDDAADNDFGAPSGFLLGKIILLSHTQYIVPNSGERNG